MAIDFSTAFVLLRNITSTAKGFASAREEFKVNEAAISLQGAVLDLQSEMMLIQADYQNVLRTKEELEKKLIEQENWYTERARYELKNVGGGNFVYSLKKSHAAIEPLHWICANCYEAQKKSILQRNPYPEWLCPRCKTNIRINDFPENTR